MKSHKKIIIEEGGGMTEKEYQHSSAYSRVFVLELMKLAAKQAFEYGRLIIDDTNYNPDEDDWCIGPREIRKYEEFEDYLKDLESNE